MTHTQHKRLYWFFLTTGLLGILEIGTVGQIPPFTVSSEHGVVSIALMMPFVYTFGVPVGSFVGVTAHLLLSLSLIWLGIAWYEHSRIKKLEKEAANKKSVPSK